MKTKSALTDCWTTMLHSALDAVEYGIVFLDDALNARFINRAFYRMWQLPEPKRSRIYSFLDLMEHGRSRGAYRIAPEDAEAYVAQRVALVKAGSQPPMQLRLADGRVLKFECIALPNAGRMLTYSDVTSFVQETEELQL